MDDIPGDIRQLVLVDARRVAQNIPLFGRQQHIFIHGVVHLVDGRLALLHHVDVAKSRRAVLFHEQRVEHERILAVIVESASGQRRVVLAGIEHNAVAEFAVVEQDPAVLVRLFIVPVHHHAFFAGVQPAVVEKARHIQHAGAVSLELGPALFQLFGVLHAQGEEVRRGLNVIHARFPIEHQQIHRADGDLAHAAALFRVPEHALDAGPVLELPPPSVAVDLLIIGLFQHHRQDARQRLCGLFIVRRAGQDVGRGIVVHSIRVLVGDGVEQPSAGRLRLALHHWVLVIFPVSHPEPQFVVHQPFVQCGLARLVFLQGRRRFRDLFRPDGRPFFVKVQFHSSFPFSQDIFVPPCRALC